MHQHEGIVEFLYTLGLCTADIEADDIRRATDRRGEQVDPRGVRLARQARRGFASSELGKSFVNDVRVIGRGGRRYGRRTVRQCERRAQVENSRETGADQAATLVRVTHPRLCRRDATYSVPVPSPHPVTLGRNETYTDEGSGRRLVA